MTTTPPYTTDDLAEDTSDAVTLDAPCPPSLVTDDGTLPEDGWLLPPVPAPASMPEPYAAWTAAYLARVGNPRNRCLTATGEMLAAFPELRRVRGYALLGGWNRDEHWWCVTTDGTIIDPTVSQYATVEAYAALDESKSDEFPTGTCADCGGDTYHGRYFCSDACERLTIAYLNSGRL